MMAILTGVRWYLIVLICISVVISNVDHLFIYHLPTRISSLKKCHFLIGLFLLLLLLLGCINCLYILESKHLPFALFATIFFHSIGCLHFFMVSFAVQNLVSLISSHLYIFVFISVTLGD